MNPIDSLFQHLRSTGRGAFMPFLTAGDPDLAFTERILPKLADAGADLIEVGFPFSDPIADGPTIQASYTRALERGLKLDDIFKSLTSVSSAKDWKTPLVGMVSYSLVHRVGIKKFIDKGRSAGLSGAIVPDLTSEESDAFVEHALNQDFKIIQMVTPTTPPARAEQIIKRCSGFLYCVSVVGITGEREKLPDALAAQLQKLRSMTDLPLCVGFGVSKPEHVRELKSIADGVIVGSALVRKLEIARTSPVDAEKEIIRLVQELSGAMHG